ncbi:MAG: Cas8a1 family CRISPR/Cas system-associated protein [Oscillospiraceae bacterium]
MDGYISTTLDGSFIKNAGICGFVKFLEMNNAEKGSDYIIKGQTLHISIEYLKNKDIPEMYVSTIAKHFENNTKFSRVITDEKEKADKYYKQLTESDDEKSKTEAEKKLKDIFKEFEDMMLKNSFKAAYEIIGMYDGITYINAEIINEMKKEKDNLEIRYRKYCDIISIVNQKIVKENLIYTELLYTKFRYCFSENSTSHKITALDAKEKRADTIYKNFYQPLLEEFDIDEKKKKNRCIECMEYSKNNRAISFMTDTADDLGKKKSYYWNCKPDAYVCPLCAFLYLFVPLGFVFIGSDAVFINTNTSINILMNSMGSYAQLIDKGNSFRQRVYRVFTSEKIDILKQKTSNFQVIVRSSDFQRYEMNVIDRNMIEKLEKGKKYLTWLETKYVKLSDSFMSVYDSVFENILAHRSQYMLIDKLMKYEFSNDGHFGYIRNILNLQIIFNGGDNMEDLKKKVDTAFMAGKAMRENILGKEKANSSDSEDDNSLRGFVYRLVNLAAVGDKSQFLDTVIRIYSGYNLTIPSIFKECYKSDDTFKAIAHGFVLGLKYVKFDDNNNKEDNKNE